MYIFPDEATGSRLKERSMPKGVRLLYEGPPASFADCSESVTAKYLRDYWMDR